MSVHGQGDVPSGGENLAEVSQPYFTISPHPDAPELSDPKKAPLYLAQLSAEVGSDHFQTTEEVRNLMRQASLVNLWFFLKCVAGFAGPFEKLNTNLHREMCNFAQLMMKPGIKAASFDPRFHFKDLDVSTPILTVDQGWIKLGEVKIGDRVFSSNGNPVEVIGIGERFYERAGYRIVFSDGEVVCGDTHLWRVVRHKRKRPVLKNGKRGSISYRESEIVEARELHVGDDIGVLENPIVGPIRELPIDPYLLGVWLGDGHSRDPRITCSIRDNELIHHLSLSGCRIRQRGYSGRPKIIIISILEMRSVFRELKLFGNKHIPEIYKKASKKQRFALLQGLMDTDGNAGGGKDGSTATFCNTNVRLVEDTYELAVSLALRPRKRKYWIRVQGKPYAFYQVSFQHFSDRNCFLLKRKSIMAKKPSLNREIRKIWRIEPVIIPETSCIAVEGGMFVVGKELIPTHNSTIFTIGAPAWLPLRDPNIRLRINASKVERASDFVQATQRVYDSNVLFAWLFPDSAMGKNQPGNNALEMLVPNRTRYFKEPTIRGGSVGEASEGDHFTGIIHDDIIGKKVLDAMGQSNVEMAKITRGFKIDNSTLIIDAVSSFIFAVGTRYGLDDTYEEIMQNLKRLYGYRKVLPLGGYKERADGEWIVYYRCVREDDENGVSRIIFPAAITEEYLEKMLDDDPWTYWTQMINLPQQAGLAEFTEFVVHDCEVVWREGRVEDEGGPAAPGWWVHILFPEEWISFGSLEITGGLDPAWTETGITAKTSRSAVEVWGQDCLRRKFLIDMKVGYVSPLTAIDWIFQFIDKYMGSVKIFYFEKAGGQKFIKQLAEEERLKREVFVSFEDMLASGDKDGRIRTVLGPDLEAGRVYANKAASLDFKAEVKAFPQTRMKDTLDGAVIALAKSIPPMSEDEEDSVSEQDEQFRTREVNSFGY